MRREENAGLPRRTFQAWLGVIALLCLAQGSGHLALAFLGNPRTMLDVEQPNGIPDLVSSAVLGIAALGALVVALSEHGARRFVASLATLSLAVVTLVDLFRYGGSRWSTAGVIEVGVAAASLVLVAGIGVSGGRRTRVTLVVAAVMLLASLFAAGVDDLDPWFDRHRGDPVKEVRLVTKEGLELAGWSLIALAVWDEALRLRRRQSPRNSQREPGESQVRSCHGRSDRPSAHRG